MFAKDGSFIRKIGNIGNGSGDYIEPSDFTIDTDNKIVYVLDRYTYRINKYDINTGRFIHSIQLEKNIRSNKIEFVGGKLFADAYFNNNSDKNYLLRLIDPSGKEEKKT